ncbi:MAG: amidohydrolase family protein [Gemmatimonadales bacterium]
MLGTLVWLLSAVASVAGVQPSRQDTTLVVIDGATLIDGRGGLPIRDAVVVVAGGRIRAAGRRSEVAVPPGATRLDARGKFLLPGFIDVHAHVTLGPVALERDRTPPTMVAKTDPEGAGRHLALLLASGITTIRDPGGVAARTVGVRDSVARGELLGPRMFVAGEVIDRVNFEGLTRAVSTPDEVRQEVRRQVAVGVDMVKLYFSLEPELVGAGIDEAHRLGVPAIGHLMATTWTEAAAMGIDGIVHLLGGSAKLLPEAARAKYQAMLGGSQFMYGWLEHLDLGAPEILRAVDLLAQRRVTLDPTLVVFERAIRGDQPEVTKAEPLQWASPALLANWRSFFTFNIGWTADDFRRAQAAWPKALGLTKLLYDRGVLLAAGTDANNPWVVPGESFHRELELLGAAGIAPLDVMTIATRNGARLLGIEADVGTIEVGKRADLVLLGADPTRSISATRAVEWVMLGGARHRPAEVIARYRP